MQRLPVRQILIALGLLVCLASGLLLDVNHQNLGRIGACVVAVVTVYMLASSLFSRAGTTLSTARSQAYSDLACGILVLDANDRIAWVNPAACTLSGQSAHGFLYPD